jgi:hypothetical protein
MKKKIPIKVRIMERGYDYDTDEEKPYRAMTNHSEKGGAGYDGRLRRKRSVIIEILTK